MACRITNIKDENLKLLMAKYGQKDGLKRFLQGELDADSALLKVQENKELYKGYNLLNKNGTLKELDANDPEVRKWLSTLNNSPYYTFKLKPHTNKGKTGIFIYDKIALMQYSISSEGLEESKSSDVVLARLENLKTNLFNLKNKTKERAKLLDINRKIKNIEEQISKLKEESSVENISEAFEYQLKWVNNLLKSPTITFDELDIADKMLSVWSDIKLFYVDLSNIDNKDLPIVELLDSIERKSKDTSTKLDLIRKKLVLDEYKANSNNPDKMSQDMLLKLTTIVPDIDIVSAYTYDASTVNNPLANFVSKTMQGSFRDAKDEVNEKLAELKKVYDALNETDKKDFSWMYSTYETLKGKPQMDFVSIISEDYYSNRRPFLNKINEIENKISIETNPAKKKELFKQLNDATTALHNWKKDNEITLDVRYLGVFEYEGISKEDTDKYIQTIYNELGTEFGNLVIERAKTRYNDYLLDKEAFEIDQENLYLENISDPEITEEKKQSFLLFKEENIKNWDLEHNPIYRLQYLEGNKTAAQLEGVYNKGYTYLVEAPKANNISEKYKQIMADPAKAAFYKYLRSLVKEMSANIPDYYKKEFVTENFVPVVRKDTLEKFSKFSFSGFLSKEYENFIADITVNDRDSSYIVRDKDGNPVKQIPVNYLNSNLPLEERSTDLYKIAQLYTLMSINYKTAASLEGFVNSTIEITKKAKIDPEIAKSPANLVKLLEYTRDAHLYNEKQAEEKIGVNLFSSKESEERFKAINNEIKDLDRQILESTDQKEIDKLKKQKSKLIKEQNALSGGAVSFGKVANKAIDITAKKAFAFNPFSPLSNISFGIVSNMSYAAGSKFVDDKSMISAFGIMLNSTQKFFSFGQGNKTADKIAGFMDYFQIETRTEQLYGVDSGNQQGFWSRMLNKGFFMMKSTDYFMRGQLSVAYALKNKVIVEGNEKALWEIFDSSGKIKEEYNTPEVKEQLKNHRETLLAIQKEVHGNFDPLSKPLLTKYAAGRLLAQFRLSWMATGIQSRFQPERFDENLGIVKGRYRSIGAEKGVIKGLVSLIFKDQFKYLINKKIYAELSEIDQLNMKRNLRELYLLELLLAIGMFLKYGLDDEDKKNRYYRTAINLINRTQDDITFYLSPSSFNSIIKNPVPALSVIDDGTKAVNSTFKYLIEDDYRTKNFILSLTRPFPGTSAVNKMVNWSEKEF